MIDLADAARGIIAEGWRVLPFVPSGKAPLGQLVARGVHDASADPAVAASRWSREPHANVGVSCRASGLLVLDVDERTGGHDDLHELARVLGPLPATIECLTGGGGITCTSPIQAASWSIAWRRAWKSRAAATSSRRRVFIPTAAATCGRVAAAPAT